MRCIAVQRELTQVSPRLLRPEVPIPRQPITRVATLQASGGRQGHLEADPYAEGSNLPSLWWLKDGKACEVRREDTRGRRGVMPNLVELDSEKFPVEPAVRIRGHT